MSIGFLRSIKHDNEHCFSVTFKFIRYYTNYDYDTMYIEGSVVGNIGIIKLFHGFLNKEV